MPLPFATPAVKILGQPLTVYGYTVQALARCNCEASMPLQLFAQMSQAGLQAVPVACPSCRRIYSIASIQMDVNGVLLFNIAHAESPSMQLD
jgi:hypothetical protein